MNQYVNDCLARGRWHRLVYEHEPFDFDNLLNRIIKRTCKLAHDFCASSTVKEKLGEILFELDEVEDVFCTVRDCDRVHLNRMHTEYQIVLDNCRMLLAQCQADNAGRDMKRFCFLLPMDRLFEEYLRVLAGKAIQPPNGNIFDWKLEDKDGKYLCENQRFRLIHDLLFERKVEDKPNFIIADAKWKNRGAKVKYGNFGVSQSDMYQMVAYAHGRGCTQVRLLYPAIAEDSKTKRIAILTTIPGEGSASLAINVQVHELQIHWLSTDPDNEKKEINEVEKAVCDAFKKMLDVT
jgi:5-methylcytosine-specific restriction enzyme subunit McrC